MPRINYEYLNSANRNQLKAYLNRLGHETYAQESTAELRDSAIAFYEQSLPEEESGLSVRSSNDYDSAAE